MKRDFLKKYSAKLLYGGVTTIDLNNIYLKKQIRQLWI
jgi:hypothetical protein